MAARLFARYAHVCRSCCSCSRSLSDARNTDVSNTTAVLPTSVAYDLQYDGNYLLYCRKLTGSIPISDKQRPIGPSNLKKVWWSQRLFGKCRRAWWIVEHWLNIGSTFVHWLSTVLLYYRSAICHFLLVVYCKQDIYTAPCTDQLTSKLRRNRQPYFCVVFSEILPLLCVSVKLNCPWAWSWQWNW